MRVIQKERIILQAWDQEQIEFIKKKREREKYTPYCSSLVHEKLSLLLLKPYALGKRTGFVFTVTFVLRNANAFNASMCLAAICKFEKQLRVQN